MTWFICKSTNNYITTKQKYIRNIEGPRVPSGPPASLPSRRHWIQNPFS